MRVKQPESLSQALVTGVSSSSVMGFRGTRTEDASCLHLSTEVIFQPLSAVMLKVFWNMYIFKPTYSTDHKTQPLPAH